MERDEFFRKLGLKKYRLWLTRLNKRVSVIVYSDSMESAVQFALGAYADATGEVEGVEEV